MIISHQYNYIFIKTQKTAGTSVEIALSKYCGPSDVITPIHADDEAKRRALGYPGPQNCYVPLSAYGVRDFGKLAINRRRISFYNHAPASFIRQYVSPDIWNNYFKFCFERNPWDKAVSQFFWHQKWSGERESTISEEIQAGRLNRIKSFDQYAIDGEIVVDHVYQFTQLAAAMQDIADRVGLPEVPALPRTKHKARPADSDYRNILSTKDRDKIAKVYAREIAHFGYEF